MFQQYFNQNIFFNSNVRVRYIETGGTCFFVLLFVNIDFTFPKSSQKFTKFIWNQKENPAKIR